MKVHVNHTVSKPSLVVTAAERECAVGISLTKAIVKICLKCPSIAVM